MIEEITPQAGRSFPEVIIFAEERKFGRIPNQLKILLEKGFRLYAHNGDETYILKQNSYDRVDIDSSRDFFNFDDSAYLQKSYSPKLFVTEKLIQVAQLKEYIVLGKKGEKIYKLTMNGFRPVKVPVRITSLYKKRLAGQKRRLREEEKKRLAARTIREKGGFHFLNFEASWIQIIDVIGSIYSVDVGWTPVYFFSNEWAARATVAAHPTKAQVGVGIFFILDTEIAARWYVEGFLWELGIGQQRIPKFKLTENTVVLRGGYEIDWSWVDNLFLSFSQSTGGSGIKKIKMGMGMTF